MKSKWITAAFSGLLAAWSEAVPCPAQPPFGLSEPGLLLFDSVTNAAGGLPAATAAAKARLPLPLPTVTWQISSGLDLVTLPATDAFPLLSADTAPGNVHP